MSHIVGKSAYKSLEERLNRLPMGAPPSETLYRILELLFSEKEAALVAQLPIKPFRAEMAAKIWKISLMEAEKILEKLAGRAILFDIDDHGSSKYMLPPPMAGFFEFALMRTRGDIDQKLLSELYHQYLNVEEDFVKDLFFGTETRQGRVFVQEGVLSRENEVHIMDYERASQVIETAEHMSISMCYCRHKNHHLGYDCEKPMDICMSFGNTAATLIKHGFARRVDKVEGMELLHQAWESELVQCGENARNEVSFICNCCGCCCEALIAAKKFGMLHPVETTNYIPKVMNESCNGCGLCQKTCPIQAISVETGEKKCAKVDEGVCLGCGICVRACRRKAMMLVSRPQRIITPINSVHRVVQQAIEKGKLQDLIFDNQAFGSHRAMAAVLGAILKLPPIQKAMASKQLKSIYLEKLILAKGIK